MVFDLHRRCSVFVSGSQSGKSLVGLREYVRDECKDLRNNTINGSETACSDEINRNDVHLIQVSFQECGGKGVCSIMDKYQQRSQWFTRY